MRMTRQGTAAHGRARSMASAHLRVWSRPRHLPTGTCTLGRRTWRGTRLACNAPPLCCTASKSLRAHARFKVSCACQSHASPRAPLKQSTVCTHSHSFRSSLGGSLTISRRLAEPQPSVALTRSDNRWRRVPLACDLRCMRTPSAAPVPAPATAPGAPSASLAGMTLSKAPGAPRASPSSQATSLSRGNGIGAGAFGAASGAASGERTSSVSSCSTLGLHGQRPMVAAAKHVARGRPWPETPQKCKGAGGGAPSVTFGCCLNYVIGGSRLRLCRAQRPFLLLTVLVLPLGLLLLSPLMA